MKPSVPKLLIAFLSLTQFNIAFSQRWELEFSSGYSLPAVSQYGYDIKETETDNSDLIDFTSHKFGLSSGIAGRLNMNYQLKPGFYLNLGTQFQFNNSRIEYASDYSLESGSYKQIDTETSDWSSRFLEIHLGMTFQTPINDKLTLFATAGPTYSIIGKTEMTNKILSEEYDNSVLMNRNYTETVSEGLFYRNIGFYSDLGMKYFLNEKFDLFLSTSLRCRSLIMRRTELTKYDEDGIDQMPNLNKSDIVTEYVESYNFNNESPTTSNKETKSGMSNAGLNFLVGVRFRFGKTVEGISLQDSLTKFYVQAGGGYGFNFNNEHFEKLTVSTFNGTTNSAIPYTYGSGINFSILSGYRMKDNFSIELGAMFNQAKITYGNVYSASVFPFVVFESVEENNFEGSMMRILTGFRIERNSNHLGSYIRTGFSLGIVNKIVESYFSEIETGTPGNTNKSSIESVIEYSGRLSLGAYGAIGFVWNFNSTWGLFAEGSFFAQNWAPFKSVLTKYKINGVDQLPSMDKADKETEYLAEGHLDYNAPYDPNAPEIDIIRSHPFSGAIFTLGVRVNLGKK
jgi:hypothetical protein